MSGEDKLAVLYIDDERVCDFTCTDLLMWQSRLATLMDLRQICMKVFIRTEHILLEYNDFEYYYNSMDDIYNVFLCGIEAMDLLPSRARIHQTNFSGDLSITYTYTRFRKNINFRGNRLIKSMHIDHVGMDDRIMINDRMVFDLRRSRMGNWKCNLNDLHITSALMYDILEYLLKKLKSPISADDMLQSLILRESKDKL